MKKHLTDFIKFLVFFSIGILFIWLSVRSLTPSDKDSILKSFQNANYWWLVPCVFIGIFSHILRARRWIILMEPLGYKPSLKSTFYAVMIGYFANMAVPRLGELTRCGILNTYEKVPFNKSFGTVITERAFDMLIFLSLFLFFVLTQYGLFGTYLESSFFTPMRNKIPNLNSYLLLIAVILIIAAFLIWFFRKRILSVPFFAKIWGVVKGFLSGITSLARIKRPLEFIILTIVIWIMYFLMVYLCFFSLPETAALGAGAGFSVLVLGSIGIMVTPGGIGLYPVIVAETLRIYLLDYNHGLAIGWISWAAQAGMIILTGTAALILLSISKKRNGLPKTS